MITVCVCTHRRPETLRACLMSLQGQRDAPDFQILVVDNDDVPSAEAIACNVDQQSVRRVQYLHAPAHNIALARNQALATCLTPRLAFFDDDQVASPHWLKQLHTALGEADAAFGPVRPIYPPAAPDWLRQGAFHQKQIAHSASNRICGYGYTANVLLRRDRLSDLSFDLALGQTGGEDTQFFKQWADRGADFRWAEAALAEEWIAPERCSIIWLIERQRASGHTHARIALNLGQSAARLFGLAMLKWIYCQAAALLHRKHSTARYRTHLRAALHGGVIEALRGQQAPRLYGKSD